MFTGIVEAIGTVTELTREGSNLTIEIESSISDQLKVDQSLAHNGVCLTVISVQGNRHRVTAIDETLRKTSLGLLTKGSPVNLERAMGVNGLLDGHIVQGHVDTTAVCISKQEQHGSHEFRFRFDQQSGHLLVDKGSICVNGVSLTVVNPSEQEFSVAIIPYTFQHTNFHQIEPGDVVNLEFDILGKYLERYLKAYLGHLTPEVAGKTN